MSDFIDRLANDLCVIDCGRVSENELARVRELAQYAAAFTLRQMHMSAGAYPPDMPLRGFIYDWAIVHGFDDPVCNAIDDEIATPLQRLDEREP